MSIEPLHELMAGRHLSRDEAGRLMAAILGGQLEPARIAAVLTALRLQGESADEIAGFAAALRARSVRIRPARAGLVDTCGTGGDGAHTFNISTATALLAAAMGIPVAKHGNRAVTSRCGSADVLEALGVRIDLSPGAVAALIDRVGIGFLFAPHLHPGMAHVATVRRQLGFRTVFNLLGPLCNPAAVKRQLLGVFAPELTELCARALRALGSERAFVVHGLEDGCDELSISGASRVTELREGELRTFEITPEELGLRRARIEELRGGSSEENAAHVEDVLAGKPGPRTDAVLLNAAFVALLAGRVKDPHAGLELARRTLDSGGGRALLACLRVASEELAGQRPALGGFLPGVLKLKAQEIEAKRHRTPQRMLRLRARQHPARDFRRALAGGGRIIAEIKRRSPRVAAYRQQGPAAGLARIYERSGAAAISIVTDREHFGTSLDDVATVRAACPLPILVKDFVIDTYQVLEARAGGADALLLIARILDAARLRSLLEACAGVGMEALVECCDREDLQRALAAGARIIGINNRDLASHAVSLDTTRDLIRQLPRGVLAVSESGIARRAQVEELTMLGVDAFLVGGALLEADDPGAELLRLRGPGGVACHG